MIEKPTLNVVVLGHVDCGKSTLIGKLLYSLGALSNEVMKEIEQESYYIGPGSYKYVNALHPCKMEQERGITVNISEWRVEIKHYYLNIIDVPGK